MDYEISADVENAHEQMLGADRLVPTAPRLPGGKNKHSPRPLGESLQLLASCTGFPSVQKNSKETGSRSIRSRRSAMKTR